MNKVTPCTVTRAGRVRTPSIATCRTTGQEQVGQRHGASSNRPFLPSWFDVGSAEIHLNSRDTGWVSSPTAAGKIPDPPQKSGQERCEHSLLHYVLAFKDAMQLSRRLGTLQLLSIQHLLLQLLDRLKQPNSETAGPCKPIHHPTFLPWSQAVALGE